MTVGDIPDKKRIRIMNVNEPEGPQEKKKKKKSNIERHGAVMNGAPLMARGDGASTHRLIYPETTSIETRVGILRNGPCFSLIGLIAGQGQSQPELGRLSRASGAISVSISNFNRWVWKF